MQLKKLKIQELLEVFMKKNCEKTNQSQFRKKLTNCISNGKDIIHLKVRLMQMT